MQSKTTTTAPSRSTSPAGEVHPKVQTELAKLIQREGVARQDWSLVFLRSMDKITEGRSLREAVSEAVSGLRGMTRLSRDLAAA